MGRSNSLHRGRFVRGHITYDKEAVEALKEMGAEVAKAACMALSEGADMVVKDAKSRCPVAANSKEIQRRGLDVGALRDSIHAQVMRNGYVYKISADAKDEKGTPYGQFVEFNPKIDRPFLYPAMWANYSNIKAKIAAAIHDAAKRANRR